MDVLSYLQSKRPGYNIAHAENGSFSPFGGPRIPENIHGSLNTKEAAPQNRRSWDGGQGGSEKSRVIAAVTTRSSSSTCCIAEKRGLSELEGR